MQSSYSVVKRNYVRGGSEKVISTEYNVPDVMSISEENLTQMELEKKNYISSYENIGKNIIEDAKRQAEKFRMEAIQKAEIIEEEAYKKGYEQGVANGYEDGKKEAIESTLPVAQKEAEDIKDEALHILLNAQADYEKYMDAKNTEIIKLSFNIANKILKREVLKDEGIDSIIEDAFEQYKGSANCVVRCNEMHTAELREKIENWKKKYDISGEIFIIEDNKVEPGNAWIEKSSGKMEVGIDIGMKKLEETIFG